MLGSSEPVGSPLVDRYGGRSGGRIGSVGASLEDEGLGVRGLDHLESLLRVMELAAGTGCCWPGTPHGAAASDRVPLMNTTPEISFRRCGLPSPSIDPRSDRARLNCTKRIDRERESRTSHRSSFLESESLDLKTGASCFNRPAYRLPEYENEQSQE